MGIVDFDALFWGDILVQKLRFNGFIETSFWLSHLREGGVEFCFEAAFKVLVLKETFAMTEFTLILLVKCAWSVINST